MFLSIRSELNMSTNHLLKSKITTTGSLSEHVASEDTNKSYNGNRSKILAPDTTTQTKITCNLSPCFSAFDVALVGTVGSERGDCVQLHNGLPHSSYTICNIVMEQPIVSPNDNKTFVYNTDVVADELTAGPQPKHNIKKEKLCSDHKTTCVKVVTDNKKSINAGTSSLHLPTSIIAQDSKSHRQLQPQIIAEPRPLDMEKLCSDHKTTCVKVVTDSKKSINAGTSSLHLPTSIIAQDSKSHRQLQPQIIVEPRPLGTSKSAGDVRIVHNSPDHGGPEKQIIAERRYKCEHDGCEKSFEYLTHLRFHVQHAHMDCCPYVCDFEGCGRCFYTLDHLLAHLRGHAEVKPFICPYEKCKKAFGTTGNLRNHIRTHTGEKPYKCSHKGCEKGFAELSSLKKHELTHTGEKPYPCRICGRCFSQAGSRNTHERHRHKDVFASCDDKT